MQPEGNFIKIMKREEKDYEEGRERRRLERGPAKALNFEKNFLQNFQTKESEQTKKRSKVLKALLNFNTAPCRRIHNWFLLNIVLSHR
jgi:hypothetical protein